VNDVSGYLLQAAVAFLVLIGLLVAAVWALRRWPGMVGMSGERRLSVVEAVAVGPGARVVLARADGRELLLGVTPHEVSLLAELAPIEKGADEAEQR